MKYKILCIWVFSFVIITLISTIFWVAFPTHILVAIMIPIEIGMVSSIVPVIIVEQKLIDRQELDKKDKLLRNKKQALLKKGKSEESEFLEEEIKILDVDDIDDDSIKVLVGNIEFLDLQPKKSTKSSIELLQENFDNKPLLEIFEKYETLDEIVRALKNIELFFFSMEFLQNIDELEWDEKDKLDFIKDMMAFTPSERMEFLNDMIQKSNYVQ